MSLLPLAIAASSIRALPRASLLLLGAIIVALLSVVGLQQCAVNRADKKADKAVKAEADAVAAHAGCMNAAKELAVRNKDLADAVQTQSVAVEAVAKASAAAQEESARLIAAIDRKAAEKEKAIDLLANALRHQKPTGACPAGEAVQVVRRGLQ